ncbi:MAG: MupA/Atu3671 family FMN-dependent luciferase-like monooxygenase [Planctomycetaceae bacterium]
MKLSIMFFSSEFREDARHSYEFVLEATRRADAAGFHAVWLPERHFHSFGGIYPNPSIIAGALAAQTRQIRIRSGSVVLPLHHPVRVAEDWAMVDRLSGGRVDMGFSKGWNTTEFVFRGDFQDYDDDRMFREIELIRKLWKGETATLVTANGQERSLSIFPRPCDSNLDYWISTFNEKLFERTGRMGGNILTGLLMQTTNQLEQKIKLFRKSAVHDNSVMTLMVHTFVAETNRGAVDIVGESFQKYLENSMTLWKQQEPRLDLPSDMRQKVLDFAFARYLKQSTLIGSAGFVADRLDKFRSIGVDEVACLLDFGAPEAQIMESLERLSHLIK